MEMGPSYLLRHHALQRVLLLAHPCATINRAPDNTRRNASSVWPAYPSTTVLCYSEAPSVNKVLYWFYRPAQWCWEATGLVYFAYDPTDPHGGRQLEIDFAPG